MALHCGWNVLQRSLFRQPDHLRDMDRFISAVEQAEDSNPDLSPLALVRTHSPCTSWGPPTTPATPTLPCLTLLSLASSTKPSTDCGEERGVILTQDGTTVAIAPMLLGIQVGLKAKLEDTLPLGMFPLTLAKNIGLMLEFVHRYWGGSQDGGEGIIYPYHKHSLATTPPLCHALDLVHQHLAKCAVDGGGLQANFTLHGHRQLVDTSCLGDALYSEIRGWEHFGVRNCSVL
uniref:Uncharacterized protein n=1 Tax=Oncorhynchus tshawytscha TaxID=74940 RepID=A0A8C8HVI1_ONCTS